MASYFIYMLNKMPGIYGFNMTLISLYSCGMFWGNQHRKYVRFGFETMNPTSILSNVLAAMHYPNKRWIFPSTITILVFDFLYATVLVKIFNINF